ncbi:MAG: aspartate ammonia-lyase [Candidatus Omnitrophota bacterium]
MEFRIERDNIGEKNIPKDRLWGIHTQRALDNFDISGSRTSPLLIRALATVKKACCLANLEAGYLERKKADMMLKACDEIIRGGHIDEFPLDALQGGAGTSTNMNMNEVIANRAIEIGGGVKGEYLLVRPIEDVNMHQSTNDVYPTAVKVAVLEGLWTLSSSIEVLQGAFQIKEKEFAGIVKTGRTEMREAVPMTLGAEFSAFAEAIARDRWRIFNCRERMRQVNIGGTAVGTGLTAPRRYVFLVIDKLRELTGAGLTRGENAVDQTANSDAFVEVAGILRAHASNIIKICNDIRILSLLGEISLAKVQGGSSIMPCKVNPVIFECALQGAIKADADIGIVFEAASRSSLQINEFMPLLSYGILGALSILERTSKMLGRHVENIKADEKICEKYVADNPLIITAFLPHLGYEKVEQLINEFSCSGRKDIKQFLHEKLGAEKVRDILSPANLMSLGYRDNGQSS